MSKNLIICMGFFLNIFLIYFFFKFNYSQAYGGRYAGWARSKTTSSICMGMQHKYPFA